MLFRTKKALDFWVSEMIVAEELAANEDMGEIVDELLNIQQCRRSNCEVCDGVPCEESIKIENWSERFPLCRKQVGAYWKRNR